MGLSRNPGGFPARSSLFATLVTNATNHTQTSWAQFKQNTYEIH